MLGYSNRKVKFLFIFSQAIRSVWTGSSGIVLQGPIWISVPHSYLSDSSLLAWTSQPHGYRMVPAHTHVPPS